MLLITRIFSFFLVFFVVFYLFVCLETILVLFVWINFSRYPKQLLDSWNVDYFSQWKTFHVHCFFYSNMYINSQLFVARPICLKPPITSHLARPAPIKNCLFPWHPPHSASFLAARSTLFRADYTTLFWFFSLFALFPHTQIAGGALTVCGSFWSNMMFFVDWKCWNIHWHHSFLSQEWAQCSVFFLFCCEVLRFQKFLETFQKFHGRPTKGGWRGKYWKWRQVGFFANPVNNSENTKKHFFLDWHILALLPKL